MRPWTLVEGSFCERGDRRRVRDKPPLGTDSVTFGVETCVSINHRDTGGTVP